MDKYRLIRFGLIFFIGFVSCMLFFSVLSAGLEQPLSFSGLNLLLDYNIQAPRDWVDKNQIDVYEDFVVIRVPGASVSSYADTGSMRPVLDAGANGIRIVPESEDKIDIGDIVTFKQGNYLIVHRVVDKGTDQNGTYFVTKGDFNDIDDGKVRFEDIRYVTVGVIW